MRVSSAEASDGGEDLVCGLGAAERLWIGILGIDVCLDCGFQGFGRAVGPALDLRFAEDCEDALELIDPGRGRSREVWLPAWPFGTQSRIDLVLWLDELSKTKRMSGSAGTFARRCRGTGGTLVPGAVTRQVATMVPAFTSNAANSDVIPVVCSRASAARLAQGTSATTFEFEPVL
jgi:hypothetical protein